MPFPQAPAGARWILGWWRHSGWFGVVVGHVGDVLDVWPNEVVQRVQDGRGGRQWEKGTKSLHSFWSQAWFSLDLWAGAESCYNNQSLPLATWLHQGISTLFSTSKYTLVLTFKPTLKMWGGMIWPWLETTPNTITVAGNFVFIILGTHLLFVANKDFHFEGSGNGPVVITWIGREN